MNRRDFICGSLLSIPAFMLYSNNEVKAGAFHRPLDPNNMTEDERIHEENQIRLREQKETEKKVELRRSKAKNDIILKALSEFSDLEALRKEKRAIMEGALGRKTREELQRGFCKPHRRAHIDFVFKGAEETATEAQWTVEEELGQGNDD